MKNYSGIFTWPVSPTENKYTYVYEHNGIDIMAKIGHQFTPQLVQELYILSGDIRLIKDVMRQHIL